MCIFCFRLFIKWKIICNHSCHFSTVRQISLLSYHIPTRHLVVEVGLYSPFWLHSFQVHASKISSEAWAFIFAPSNKNCRWNNEKLKVIFMLWSWLSNQMHLYGICLRVVDTQPTLAHGCDLSDHVTYGVARVFTYFGPLNDGLTDLMCTCSNNNNKMNYFSHSHQ